MCREEVERDLVDDQVGTQRVHLGEPGLARALLVKDVLHFLDDVGGFLDPQVGRRGPEVERRVADRDGGQHVERGIFPGLVGQVIGIGRLEADPVEEDVQAVRAGCGDGRVGGAAHVACVLQQHRFGGLEIDERLGELDGVPLAILVGAGVEEAVHGLQGHGQLRADGHMQEEGVSRLVLVDPAALDRDILASHQGEFGAGHCDEFAIREGALYFVAVQFISPAGAPRKKIFPFPNCSLQYLRSFPKRRAPARESASAGLTKILIFRVLAYR